MKKVKFTSFGKGFHDPFAADPDYYKTVTYEDVFKAVENDINNNFYTCTKPAEGIRLKSDIYDLTSSLKAFVPWCPDLFESDLPDARKLVAHFGKLIQKVYYGRTYRERREAKNAIYDILNNPHPHAKWSKVRIPPFLSLNDMCAYIHQITKYLKKQYIKSYGLEDTTDYKTLEESNADKRLIELARKRYIKMLVSRPKELTITLVAAFLGLSSNGLKQQLKEERQHPNVCHSNW